jgi:hypothetical protein
VFSNPDVIRRVNADFVPVALKAALVNNPPGDEEGRHYREIGRSKPAPQGICVVNSAGKVLDWVLMFDDDRSVLEFLDHVLDRFHEYPDASRQVAAERYMKFPSQRLEDVADRGDDLPVIERHREGMRCPAHPPIRAGTVIARLFGRALDEDGEPLADVVRQEHYVEDRWTIDLELQERLANSLSDAGTDRFLVPDELARLLIGHAYLGQLDVNPLGSPAGGDGDVHECRFWAQRVAPSATGIAQLRIEGESDVAGAQEATRPDRGDGRMWEHEVKLAWLGWIEMRGERISRLLLVADGLESLTWGNGFRSLKGEGDVAHLPAGHPIDLACGVRYGILGEPVDLGR